MPTAGSAWRDCGRDRASVDSVLRIPRSAIHPRRALPAGHPVPRTCRPTGAAPVRQLRGGRRMSGLRVLITNITLATRTGTETYVRDLALGLARRGHHPVVYSTDLGDIAREIEAGTV